MWDAETGTVRHTLLGHTGFVLGVAWSPDSSRLVTGGSDGTAKVWEIGPEGVRERWSLSAQETKSGIVGVAFSPDGTRVMAGDASISAVQVWDLGPTGDAEWANLPAAGLSRGGVHAGRTARGDEQLGGRRRRGGRRDDLGPADRARPSNDRAADRLFLGFAILRREPRWFVDRPRRRQQSPSGFGGASAARAWDTSTGEELWRIGHDADVNEVAFSPDGEYVATASWEGVTKIVDRSGRVIRVLEQRTRLQLLRRRVQLGRPPGGHGRVGPAPRSASGSGTGRGVRSSSRSTRRDPGAQVDFDPNGPRVAVVWFGRNRGDMGRGER